MLVDRLKEIYKPEQPIFIEDILIMFPDFSRAYIFRLLKQAKEKGTIVRFDRGVYYLPKKTSYGFSTINSSVVAQNKYVSDGVNTYGVYSGLALLNQFAVSSQVPNVVEIITNNEATRKRVVNIDGMKYIVRKSRFKITDENCDYYVILQLFTELGKNPKLDEFSKQRITSFINEKKIDQRDLIKMAFDFPAQTLKNLIRSEILNETISR